MGKYDCPFCGTKNSVRRKINCKYSDTQCLECGNRWHESLEEVRGKSKNKINPIKLVFKPIIDLMEEFNNIIIEIKEEIEMDELKEVEKDNLELELTSLKREKKVKLYELEEIRLKIKHNELKIEGIIK